MLFIQDAHRTLEAYEILFFHPEFVTEYMRSNMNTPLCYEFKRLITLIGSKDIQVDCNYCGELGVYGGKARECFDAIPVCRACIPRIKRDYPDAAIVKDAYELLSSYDNNDDKSDMCAAILYYCACRGLSTNNDLEDTLPDFFELDKRRRLYVPCT